MRVAKIALAVLAVLALAGCAAAEQPVAITVTPTPTAEPSAPALQTIEGHTFSAEGPGDCTTNAAIHPYGAGQPGARLRGELVDMGVSEFASGEVGYTADGLIETYTVQPGDALIAIGERFCIDYVTVGAYNDRFAPTTIQPGDVLVLRPGPTAPRIPGGDATVWTRSNHLPLPGWMPAGQEAAAKMLYSAGVALYSTGGTDSFTLPLPDGYTWPADLGPEVTSTGFPDVHVWYAWVAANATAALNGDETAAAALAELSVTLGQAFDPRVRTLINDRDYSALLQILPLPDSMRR